MEQVPKVFLTKLLQKSSADSDTKCHTYMRSKWLDNAMEFVLQDGDSDKCYKGRLTNDEVQEAATELDIPYGTFYEEIFGALSNNLAPGFISEIDASELTYRLIRRGDLDMIYIEMKLRELQNNHELLETAIELIEKTSQKQSGNTSSVLETQSIIRSSQQNENTTNGMSAEEKTNMLKKFAMLLNAKKAKVEELEEKLQLNGENGSRPASSASEDEQMADVNAEAGTSRRKMPKQKRTTRITTSDNEGEDDFTALTQPMTQTGLPSKTHNPAAVAGDNSGDSEN